MGEITVTEHQGYLEFHFVGAFDDVSLYQAFRELWTAGDYNPIHNELSDFRHADLTQLTGEGLRRVMDLSRQLNVVEPPPLTALLVGDDLHYGLSRMSSALAADWSPNFRVFRDHDEAVAWILTEEAHPS